MAAVARTKANLNDIFAQAVDSSIRKHGEVGLHVAIYQDGHGRRLLQVALAPIDRRITHGHIRGIR